MNFRQVHLDFHTSEKIPAIGSRFSKKQFQEALKTGHVNSVTVFAKCHHGWAYHKSSENIMHPNLGFDLLREEIEAAHEIGVKAVVYLSAGLDEKTAVRHADWLVRNKDESTTWVPDFSVPGYHKLCMNSPYLDYLLKELAEVCKNYDADGIFLDIVGVQPCYCRNCMNALEGRGLDPYDEKNVVALAEEVYANYTRRVRETVDKFRPGLPVFHNGGHIRRGRRDLAHMNSHLEIESLPTGGWGYDHFPLTARYVQNLGMEYVGMTGKFHITWGEFGGFKHPNALRYEAALSAANGAKCSVGDQLAPDGCMDMETYRLIGAAYSELEEKEPWLDNVASVADVGLLSYECISGDFSATQASETNDIDAGACRILLEGKYLFDVIDLECRFDKYKVIVLPDAIDYSEKLYNKLKRFVENGGKLLATGESGLDCAKENFVFDFGAVCKGRNEYSPDYFRPKVPMEGLGDTGYIIYEDGMRIEAVQGAQLAIREEPYFNRAREHFCSHRNTPDSGRYGGAGMTAGGDGIYIAWKIFTEYARIGSISAKKMVIYALDQLLGADKSAVSSLPAQGIMTLMTQNDRKILHLLYASPVCRGKGIEVIEDIIPLYNVKAAVKLDKKPKRVYIAPQMHELEFDYTDGTVNITVPEVYNHQMVVFE